MSSSTFRITGLATGLDVDSIVQSLMKAENTKLDKLKQDKQLIQWRQDLYRDIIGDLNTFKSTYFDVLKTDTYMLSNKIYSSFDVKSSDASNSVTASATSGAIAGQYTISVAQIAEKARFTGTSKITASVYDKMSNIVSGEVKFTINNQTFHYDFNSSTDYGTPDDPVIGAKDKTISDIINDISSKANVNITYSELTQQFTLTSKNTGESQVITNTKDVTGNFLKTIFGQAMISDESGYLYDSDGNLTGTLLKGKDAQVTITEPYSSPVTITKSSNNFTIDGINYTLNSKPASDVTLTVTLNPDTVFDKIKAFIEKYNELIDKINTKLNEKRQYNYPPLTDDQKKEMKDDEIKNWEDKAKEGLLANDSTLSNMLNDLRRAFYDKVEGAGIYLTDIGLSTSSDISERGKIIIDETKLKQAIQNNPEKVANLFAKASSTPYSPDQRSQARYNEEGIFQRINDILQDYIRTTRDSHGNKGILIQKAGIKGDFSEFQNILSDQLKDKDKQINDMIEKLNDKENNYYLQFSKLETAMEQMNQQQTWLTQQLGGK